MPLQVKDYTWSETEKEVIVKVPLKGVNSSRADIFSTNRYVKVNYPPYLFEVHLFAPVVEEKCTAKVGNGVIEFILIKEEHRLWGTLVSEESQDKAVMMEKRQEAMDHAAATAAKVAEDKAKKIREEKTFAIKKEMKIEEDEREKIERIKKQERERTERELDEWKEKKQLEKSKLKEVKKSEKKELHSEPIGMPIWKEKKSADTKPPPRKTGSIQVRFTPRVFPTAARESKLQEEQEWLTKMAAARKIKVDDDSEKSINEKNPEFLKDKGVNLFKNKDYRSAINAFSEAIKLNSKLPQLYSNRAACCLALGDDEKCIYDCCTALELYYPVVPSNYEARAKVFVRRGTAYANQGQLALAAQDFSAAMKLCPDNDKLKEDYAKIQTLLTREQT